MANPVWASENTPVSGDSTCGGTQTLPSGTAAGDLLLIELGFEKGTDITISNHGGWTLPTNGRGDQSTNIGLYCGYRLVSAGDVSAGNVARPTFNQAAKWTSTFARITGQHATTPFNIAQTANSPSGNPDPPSITTTVDECLVVAAIVTKSQTTFTPPSGYTEEIDTSSLPALSAARINQASAGAINPGTFTPGSASEWCAVTLAIAPATGAAGQPAARRLGGVAYNAFQREGTW